MWLPRLNPVVSVVRPCILGYKLRGSGPVPERWAVPESVDYGTDAVKTKGVSEGVVGIRQPWA